jgi:hypothetical protein
MPLPVISDGYYCAYRFTLVNAQSAEVTFSVTAPSTTAADVADDIEAAWASSIKNAQSDSTMLVSTSVTPLDGTAAATITPVNITGTNTEDPVPDSIAAIVTLRTGLAGRSNRGRMYWPGMGVDMLSGDGYTLDSSFITGFQSAVDSWHSAMSGTSETLGVLSRALSSFREVTSLEVRRTIGTQRRRLTGGVIF